MNKDLLEYEMKKKKVSIADMCEKLGISKSAFYRKCNGKSEFTQSEIQRIVDLLNLETPMGIFFEAKVAHNECMGHFVNNSVKNYGRNSFFSPIFVLTCKTFLAEPLLGFCFLITYSKLYKLLI